MAKISVIVPVYGVEKYIERCADSLFLQTLDDVEYIFVDDCTPDRSIELLEEKVAEYQPLLARDNKVVQIIRMQANSGLPAVRQRGVTEACGDFLIHCDSDDWMDLNMLEILYSAAVAENADIAICDFYRSDGSNHCYVNAMPKKALLQGPVWNKLVKTSIYKDNEIEFPRSNKAEDGVIMTQISFFSKKIIYVSSPLYYYYINPQSICGQISEKACLSKLKQECDNVDLRIRFLAKHNALKEHRLEIIYWKMCARDNLLPIIDDRKYYKLWNDIYPEIDHTILLSKNFRLILKYFLIKIRLHKLFLR